MYPLAVLTGYDALCTEDNAVGLLVAESIENRGYLVLSVGIGSFSAPACEYIVSVVVVMMFVLVVMVVTATGAVRTMIVMMMLVLIVVVMMFMLMVVVMIMIVTAAGAVRTVIVVVMMMLSLLEELLQLIVKGVLLSHSINELLSCELIPLRSYDRCSGIELLEALYAFVDLILGKSACMAEDKAARIGYLIVEELA